MPNQPTMIVTTDTVDGFHVLDLTREQAEELAKKIARLLGAALVYPDSQEDVLYHMDYK